MHIARCRGRCITILPVNRGNFWVWQCNYPPNSWLFFSLLQLPSYPEISIGRDALHLHPGTYAGYGRDDNRQILVRPANETIVKRLTRTLFEDGFLQALNEAHEAPEANPILRSIAGYIKRLFDATAQVNTYFCPYFRYERNVASVSKMFETR